MKTLGSTPTLSGRRCITRKQAIAKGLPWGPPPDLRALEADGYEAADEYCSRECLYESDKPDECPWPINTDEGRAWLAGWNRYCRENGQDEIRSTVT